MLSRGEGLRGKRGERERLRDIGPRISPRLAQEVERADGAAAAQDRHVDYCAEAQRENLVGIVECRSDPGLLVSEIGLACVEHLSAPRGLALGLASADRIRRGIA